jgi:hypothetical protein
MIAPQFYVVYLSLSTTGETPLLALNGFAARATPTSSLAEGEIG